MKIQNFSIDYAGKEVIFETGRLATQTSGSITARMGDTVVLATVNMSKRGRDINFFPLMVDLEERYAAAGRIKGPRFSKREGRPSSDAMLVSRKIDRGMRPLFRQEMRNDIQIICLPLSLDYENKVDIVAMLAACAAVHISAVPFDGPIAGVRIGMVDGEYVVNPTEEQLEISDLDLMVMGDGERITMIDCRTKDLPDDVVKGAFPVAYEAMGPMAKFFEEIREKVGVPKATDDELILKKGTEPEDAEIIEEMKGFAMGHLDKYLFNQPVGSKGDRKDILSAVEEKIVAEFAPKAVTEDRNEEAAVEYIESLIKAFFFDFIEEQVTLAILDRDQRVDGRALDQIRNLEADVAILPRTHGSGLFSRGETQVLSTVTLGAPGDKLSIETMDTDDERKYFHHYNFLPFSVGDVKPLRGAGRRDIGHGRLAEKALDPVIPEPLDFPYTVRVTSEVISSNGSSSMASTCGSTLALLDAGVPIKSPVAGIAIGLASDGERWKVLTDLQDLEDGPGGMDFKATGTKEFLTSIQMDTKTRGLTMEMIDTTFPITRKALDEIIDVMHKAIPEPRAELSPYAPRIIILMINPEKIGDVIGPGGKMIRSITDELDVSIDIEDDGSVFITSTDAEAAEKAKAIVEDIVRVVEVGEVYEDAEVVRIMNFGAFVKLTPSTDGMVHVSEIEWGRVNKVTDRINIGDRVNVKVIGIEDGKVDVSMKALPPALDRSSSSSIMYRFFLFVQSAVSAILRQGDIENHLFGKGRQQRRCQ